jgi:hypothetical protein
MRYERILKQILQYKKVAEAEEDLEKDGISMRDRNRLEETNKTRKKKKITQRIRTE